jgi:hypothetical protein
VLTVSKDALGNYAKQAAEKQTEEWVRLSENKNRKHKQAIDKWLGDNSDIGGDAARIIYERTVSKIAEEYLQAVINSSLSLYNKIRSTVELVWERMLPFARCSGHPESAVPFLYSNCLLEAFSPIDSCVRNQIMNMNEYYPDAFSKDLEAAIREHMASKEKEKYDEQIANCPTLTASLGPFELKLGARSIELEYVKGVAGRISYNWKTGIAEAGIGGGVKGKLGIIGGETKGYLNVAFDVRNKEVTDVYMSAEAKATMGKLETGMTGKVSLMGKGASLSGTNKANFGHFGVEHETELFNTGSY